MSRGRHSRRRRKRRISGLVVILPLIAAIVVIAGLYKTMTPNEEVRNIPIYYQFDSKWASHPYGKGIIELDGCGPTSVAMVAAGLKGDSSITPDIVADYAAEHGYISDGATAWTFMSKGCEKFGVKSKELPLSETIIRKNLTAGHPIICSVGKGDFTEKGHFIVLTGIDENGKLIINDPNSRENSAKHWDIQRVMGQVKNLWAFTKK